MIKFDPSIIEQKVAPHYHQISEIVKSAFNDFQKIPAVDGVEYNGMARAWIMLCKIKDKLSKANFVLNGNASIEPYYSTFLLNIEGIKISFNKLDSNKRKSSDTSNDSLMNLPYSIIQLPLFSSEEVSYGDKICEETPLTIGYILDTSKTALAGIYITYQLGQTVKWYLRIDDNQEFKAIPFKPVPPKKSPSNKKRVRAKTEQKTKTNIIKLKE